MKRFLLALAIVGLGAVASFSDNPVVESTDVDLTGTTDGGGTGILTNMSDIYATTFHGSGAALTGISAGDVFTASNNTFVVGGTNIFNGRTVLGGLRATVGAPWVFQGYTINSSYPNVSFGDTAPDGKESIIHAFVVTNMTANQQSYIYVGDNSTANGLKLGTYKAEGAFIGFKTQLSVYDSNRNYFMRCNETTGGFYGFSGFGGLFVGQTGSSNTSPTFAVKNFQVGPSGTFITNILSTTVLTNFGTVNAGAATELAIPLTGAKDNSAVALRNPAGIPAGVTLANSYCTNGVLVLRCDNPTAAPVDVSTDRTYGATVISY